jgi:lipopolysaccharide/colanic/teichoic acid biosynthesis glycosyltransferase
VQTLIKRVVDLGLASVGLVLLTPVMVLIAVAIKLDSEGPIIFGQERIGRNFRAFRIYKFRSMKYELDDQGPQITATGDPRVTRVGRLLRKTKLDELPQLFNVLKGDMSLVGPRPEVRRYVEKFAEDYREILTVRPGMTDLASLKYVDESAVLEQAADPEGEYVTHVLPEKLELAKQYVRSFSLLLDLGLIAQTVLRIVRR